MNAQQYFETSSCMFSDKNTLIKIWLNPGLNLTIFCRERSLGPVPARPISVNPGLKFCSVFIFFDSYVLFT